MIEERTQSQLNSLSHLLTCSKHGVHAFQGLLESSSSNGGSLQSRQQHVYQKLNKLFRTDLRLFNAWPFSYLSNALDLFPFSPSSFVPLAAATSTSTSASTSKMTTPTTTAISSSILSSSSSSSSSSLASSSDDIQYQLELLLNALQLLPLDVSHISNQSAVLDSISTVIETLEKLSPTVKSVPLFDNSTSTAHPHGQASNKANDNTNIEQLKIISLFAVVKCCILLRNAVFQQTLDVSVLFEQHLQYWETGLSYPLYYYFQALPYTLWSLSNRVFDKTWTRSQLLHQLIFSPLQQMQKNYTSIQTLKSQQASLLGYLSHWRKTLDPCDHLSNGGSKNNKSNSKSVQTQKEPANDTDTDAQQQQQQQQQTTSVMLASFSVEFITFILDAFNRENWQDDQESSSSQSHSDSHSDSDSHSHSHPHSYSHSHAKITTLGNLIDSLASARAVSELHLNYVHKKIKAHGIPNRWARFWIPITLVSLGSWIVVRELKVHRETVIGWIQNSKETLIKFSKEWLYRPLQRIYETVRYEENQMALINAKSLQNDIDSLERMVTDFAMERLKLSPSQLTEIASNARDGDLSVVMREYEMNLREPYKSLIFGDMVRTALIQVQKSKVDLELAMTSIDKLMKSNELNFQVLAAIPTFLSVRFLSLKLSSLWKHRNGLPHYEFRSQIRIQLRRLEIILNKYNFSDSSSSISFEDEGLVLICLHMLRLCANALNAKDFIDDLKEIENYTEHQVAQRLSVIYRMYRTHELLSFQ